MQPRLGGRVCILSFPLVLLGPPAPGYCPEGPGFPACLVPAEAAAHTAPEMEKSLYFAHQSLCLLENGMLAACRSGLQQVVEVVQALAELPDGQPHTQLLGQLQPHLQRLRRRVYRPGCTSPEAHLPTATSPRAATHPQPQPHTHLQRRIKNDVPPAAASAREQTLGPRQPPLLLAPPRQPRAQVCAPPQAGRASGQRLVPRPRDPSPGPPRHSLLVLEEVLCSLAVPHHLGPVVLQRLDVPGGDGLWVRSPTRPPRWVGAAFATTAGRG